MWGTQQSNNWWTWWTACFYPHFTQYLDGKPRVNKYWELCISAMLVSL